MGTTPSTTNYEYSGGGGGGSSVVRVSRNGVFIKQIEATGGGGGGSRGYQNSTLLPADGGEGGSWSSFTAGGVGGGGGGAGLPGSQYIDNALYGSGGYPSNGNGSASAIIYYVVPS